MFVLAIGMIGVLALFPLGAAQMANAVKDERALQMAQVMEGQARILWRGSYPGNISDTTPGYGFNSEPGLQAFNNPDPGAGASGGSLGLNEIAVNNNAAFPIVSATSTEPSFPIYFDPIGRAYQSGLSGPWVGGVANVLPRRTVAAIAALPTSAQQTAARIRLFGLMDDIIYKISPTPQGLSANSTNTLVDRGGRYSAATLVQRANNATNYQASLSVIVYQNRPIADTPSTETVVASGISIIPGSTSIGFPKGGIPSLRKGSWILIAGQIPLTNGAVVNPTHPTYAFANFYRIVSVQDDGVNFGLEVSPPLKDNRPPQKYWPNYPGAPYYLGTIIAMDNVAEVFDRPTLLQGN
jgi:hypothetical protein